MTAQPEPEITKREKAGLTAFTKRFRGEIYEDDSDVGLTQDDGQGNKPFDITTAYYLKKPFEDSRKDTTRLQVMTAANQIGKSLWAEMVAKYKIKHDPANTVLYDQTIDASRDHMKTRFMPFLKSIPTIGRIIEEVEANNRFEVTTGDIMLPGMVLRGRPLNEQGTQRITARHIFVHDACLSERNGQLFRVRKRFTQFLGRELFCVESQGGVIVEDKPDDFTVLSRETDEGELWIRCPHCNCPQNFTLKGWQRPRPDSFVPTPPKTIASLDHAAWIEHHRELFLKPENRMAGFKRGDELGGKLPEGMFDAREILAKTVYICFDCGSVCEDTPQIRKAIDLTSHYIPTNLSAPIGKYGYRIPAWINQRIPWGLLMLEKVQADHAKALGNDLGIQDWETKRAAATFDPKAHMVKVASVTTTQNPLKAIPNELFRSMEVDCQKDKQLSAAKGEDMTGHFWVTATATDRQGNDVQLWRGYCVSWEEWILKYKELGIPVENVSIDISYKPDEVKSMAAKHAELKDEILNGKMTGRKFWATWMMMRGSDRPAFPWDDGKMREFRYMKPEEATIWDARGNARVINVPLVEWSNFRFKNILHAQLTNMPGMPSFKRLPDNCDQLTERTILMENRVVNERKEWSWDEQMNSEVLGEKKKWVPVHNERHYRDCCCMQKVRKMQAGAIGRTEIATQDAQEAG